MPAENIGTIDLLADTEPFDDARLPISAKVDERWRGRAITGVALLKLVGSALVLTGEDEPAASLLVAGRRAFYFRTDTAGGITECYVSLDGISWKQFKVRQSLPEDDYCVWSVDTSLWSFDGYVWIFQEDELEPFEWSSEDDISVLRGGNAVVVTVDWEQGSSQISDFSIDDITIQFYADSAKSTEITDLDDAFRIGDETLAEIVTLENFVDGGDGTGSVDVRVDPSGITAQELDLVRQIYFDLAVTQP